MLDLRSDRLELGHATGRDLLRIPRRGQQVPRLLDASQIRGQRLHLSPRIGCSILGHLVGTVEALEAEHALEHLVALGRLRRQELGESVLGQQDRAAERPEVHAEQRGNSLVHRGLAGHVLETLRVRLVGGQQIELVAGLAAAPQAAHGPPHLAVR